MYEIYFFGGKGKDIGKQYKNRQLYISETLPETIRTDVFGMLEHLFPALWKLLNGYPVFPGYRSLGSTSRGSRGGFVG